MKRIGIVLLSIFFWTTSALAAGELLKVGIVNYNPPFVMHEGSNRVYGFDIDMINSVCKIIERTCQFQVMRFDQLLDAVNDKTIDIAVSDITITPERAQRVSFSLPYMLSKSMFLEKTQSIDQPFSLEALSNKKIGISTGSVFENQIIAMGIKNPTIKQYQRTNDLLEALSSGSVDYILIDAPTAHFWEANSGGDFKTFGKELEYGNGIGIALSPDNNELLEQINNALLQYQNSPDFKASYDRYFSHF